MSVEQIKAVEHAVVNVLGCAFVFFVTYLIYRCLKDTVCK